ncbi:MAG: FAD-dependent oxidoreductase [Algoriphagus sp.]|uniref:FAD-dependent oxidoreductase n=1 Tax=Algoriphagus sp. TaxID=1872435 RepID=UPI00262F4F7C|nr:FAD-dependent oxidoreductase [Algoriphagus sp.]MDG1275652.1 FAD-dependent oxidoreductase [Algoriphagus sp.]
MKNRHFIVLVTFLLIELFSFKSFAQQSFDLIVVGGGASGTSAGISAGRLGIKTLIIEESTWLGGMLTAAGVSAIDGNDKISGGFYGEFKQGLEEYYGGPKNMATGWVSNTLFEPKVASELLQKLASQTPNLEISFESIWNTAIYEEETWTVTFVKAGKEVTVTSTLLIDATELGDVAAAQGLKYRLGMDASGVIGEIYAPVEANNIIQDLTYVATLQDYGAGADKTIPKPANYDPTEFACACAHADPTTDNAPTLDCGKMLDYGKLPNGKYMINWPNCGNDYYLNIVEMDRDERREALKAAKAATLRFVYYIQYELGFKHLGLAEEEYPTADDLPMIPYHRESRRYYGLVDFTLPYVLNPYTAPNPYYRTGAIVGDYTIDHHHKKNLEAPAIDFIKIRVPSYNVPLGALVPKDHKGLILAEKSISVSNIVNGATRLQPVVLGIGQAAGTLACVSLKTKKAPAEVSIRSVQQTLLDQGAYLMPFIDIDPSSPHFQAVQKIGVSGVLKGEGVPYLWANQTWFYPERLVSEYELVDGLRPIFSELKDFWGASGTSLTGERFQMILEKVKPNTPLLEIAQAYKRTGLSGQFTTDKKLNRLEVAVLIDELLNPFEVEVNWEGEFK